MNVEKLVNRQRVRVDEGFDADRETIEQHSLLTLAQSSFLLYISGMAPTPDELSCTGKRNKSAYFIACGDIWRMARYRHDPETRRTCQGRPELGMITDTILAYVRVQKRCVGVFTTWPIVALIDNEVAPCHV